MQLRIIEMKIRFRFKQYIKNKTVWAQTALMYKQQIN